MTLTFGIDPGATHKKHSDSQRGTGWCLMAHYDDLTPNLVEWGHVVGGPAEWLHAVFYDAHLSEALWKADRFVCENFVMFNDRAKPDPLQIIGQMEMYAMLKEKQIIKRMPGQRLAVSHDDLKRIGMWPGAKGHADTAQAIRHVLAQLMQEGNVPTMAMVSPDDTGD